MMRETVRYLGGDDSLGLQLITAKDRLRTPIAYGDTQTAEGEAHLQGNLSGIPVNLWLNKYAGPGVERKGISIHLRDGRIIRQSRVPGGERVELLTGEQALSWTRSGAIYDHCLGEHILAPIACLSGHHRKWLDSPSGGLLRWNNCYSFSRHYAGRTEV